MLYLSRKFQTSFVFGVQNDWSLCSSLLWIQVNVSKAFLGSTNKQYCTRLKVQERHHWCHPERSYPRCSCAVAVSSGKDVFIVDICNKQPIIHFPSCGDGVLKVIKTNDKYFKVFLISFKIQYGVTIYKLCIKLTYSMHCSCIYI